MIFSSSPFFNPDLPANTSVYKKSDQLKLAEVAKSKSKGSCEFVPSKHGRSADQQHFDNVYRANPLKEQDNKFSMSPRGVSSVFSGSLSTKWHDRILEHPVTRRNHESQEYMCDSAQRHAYELSSCLMNHDRVTELSASKTKVHEDLLPSFKTAGTVDSTRMPYSHDSECLRGRLAPAIGTAAPPPGSTDPSELITGGASGRSFIPPKESVLISRKYKDDHNDKITSSPAAIDIAIDDFAQGRTQTAVIRKLEGTNDYAGRRPGSSAANEIGCKTKNLVTGNPSATSRQWKAFDQAGSPANPMSPKRFAGASFPAEPMTRDDAATRVPMGTPEGIDSILHEEMVNERRRTEKNFSSGLTGVQLSPRGKKVRADALDRTEIRPATVSNWSPQAETLARQNKAHGADSPIRSAEYSKTVKSAVISAQHTSGLFDRVSPVVKDKDAAASFNRDAYYMVSRAIPNRDTMVQAAEIERRKAEKDFYGKNENAATRAIKQLMNDEQKKSIVAGVPSKYDIQHIDNNSNYRPSTAREMMLHQMKSSIF